MDSDPPHLRDRRYPRLRDLLDRLLDQIAAHAGDRPHKLVFLGDYIDRGPDSAAVLRTVSRLNWAEPDRVTCLMGNHERMLLDAIQTPSAAAHWMYNGGEATMDSFGARDIAGIPRRYPRLDRGPADAARGSRPLVRACRPATRHGGARSDPHDRLWIREPFLEGEHDFGRHVVHGHTPQRSGRPELCRFRTNLDTAAVYGGALTAGVFSDAEGPPMEFLQVRAR